MPPTAIPHIAGAIGWCAFDYNTHKDFGSGDRICHHGVMDMFREPKFAAFAYASQCEPDEAIVLQPVTFWARGERNIGGVLPLMVLTNCEEVELRYGNNPPKRLGTGARPVSPSAACAGHLRPTSFQRRRAGAMGHAVAGRDDHRPDRRQAGRPRSAIVADPVATKLEVVADRATISPAANDCVRVMVRALDQAGHKLPFLFEPVEIDVSGAGRLVGPKASCRCVAARPASGWHRPARRGRLPSACRACRSAPSPSALSAE